MERSNIWKIRSFTYSSLFPRLFKETNISLIRFLPHLRSPLEIKKCLFRMDNKDLFSKPDSIKNVWILFV